MSELPLYRCCACCEDVAKDDHIAHGGTIEPDRHDLPCLTCEEALRNRAVLARVWDEGYRSGSSNAMRRMSDEPNAPTTPNPYRAEEAPDARA